MAARATASNKVKSKVPPSRLQVYLADETLGAALEREAKVNRISLSQAAALMIAKGLKSRISADPHDRLMVLERRLSEHMRLSARDFVIIEEMLFVTMKMLVSRFPEADEERSAPYRASVENSLQVLMGEVAERVRRTSPTKPAPNQSEGKRTAPEPANDPTDDGLPSAWSSEA
jgi:hypothetical protein